MDGGNDACDMHEITETTPIIILDWDDTLLPTSWLHTQQRDAECELMRAECVLACAGSLSDRARRQLRALDGELVTLLSVLARLGTVLIVTNASEMYVSLTAAAFLPYTATWMRANEVCVMSARDLYETAYPTNVAAWKQCAFRDVVAAWQATHFGVPPACLVSVGDSQYERDAVRALATQCERVKSIKLKEFPRCRDLVAQAKFLASEACALVNDVGSTDMTLILSKTPSPVCTNRCVDNGFGEDVQYTTPVPV